MFHDKEMYKFLQCVVCVRNTQNRGLEKSQGWLTTIWPFFQQRKGALQIAAQLGISNTSSSDSTINTML